MKVLFITLSLFVVLALTSVAQAHPLGKHQDEVRAPILHMVDWHRGQTWYYQDQMGERRTRTVYAERKTESEAFRMWVRDLWAERHVDAKAKWKKWKATYGGIPGWIVNAFMCIYGYENGGYGWTANTGNGYYGGLQMDTNFQAAYGPEFVRRWGTANNWPVWAQLRAAYRGWQARGFYPWPNTARYCGLI